MREVRLANYPVRRFESYLLPFAYHEMYAARYTQSESAFAEALKVAAQIDNDTLAYVFEGKGDLYLRENNLPKADNAFQASLDLRKVVNDKASLSWAYACLSEVARRSGDLEKREEHLKNAMQSMDYSTWKANYLVTLALIAAQNKRAPRAKGYFDQWKELIKKDKVRNTTFILEDDLKNLLKITPAERMKFNFKKLESQDSWPYQKGYSLNTQEVTKLMQVTLAKNQH